MPALDAERSAVPADAAADAVPGRRVAIAAETLFLLNLTLAPVIAFGFLAVLWQLFRHDTAPPLARGHVRQTFWGSLWGGSLLGGLSVVVVLLGDLNSVWTWMAVIMYFTCVHSALILLGVIGLSRANAGRPWRLPLIGPR